MLRLSDVTQRFGDRTVLNEVSLEVAAGEYVAVVGESGIGKSTLLNVIAGLEPTHSGEIVFENQKLNDMDDDARTILRDRELTVDDGTTVSTRHLADEGEVLQVLADTFGLAFPAGTHFVVGPR